MTALIALSLLVTLPAGATVPGDLCTGNPCVISSNATIDDGSNLDFGDVDVVVEEDVVLSIDGDGASVDIQADSFVMEPGATIQPLSQVEYGPYLNIYTDVGNVEMQADGTKRSRIDLTGMASGSGGDLTVTADGTGADLLFDGIVESRGGSGGYMDLEADNDLRVFNIDSSADSAVDALGGAMEFDAGNDLDITGQLSSGAPGTSGEGADQYVTAGGDIHLHPGAVMDVSSTGAGSVTGTFSMTSSTGNILIEGQMLGTTPSSFESTDAGIVDMYANAGNITISALINMTAGNNGYAYDSTFDATGDLTVLPGGKVLAGSKGPNGQGGGLSFRGQHVSIQEDLDISGGGEGTNTIEIDAVLTATIDAKLKATSASGGDAGQIDVSGCDVTIAEDGKLEVKTGSTGSVNLEGGRQVVVLGQLKAGDSNTIEYDLNYPQVLGNVTPAATITQTADSSACGPLALCGDGLLDVGEQCDDGNVVDGDCCSSGCAAESLGSACGIDWGLCATSQCDGAGSCGISTAGASCFLPVLGPTTQLQFSDKSNDKGDLASFKWLKGDEVPLVSLPDPVAGDDVELCVYNSAGQPIFRAAAPGGGTCAGKPCWKASSTGYKYSDKERTPDGVLKVSLKAGDQLKGKADLKAKGENIPPMPSLPLQLPVTAQLQSSTGTCWEASFDATGVIKNTPEQFKGRAMTPGP